MDEIVRTVSIAELLITILGSDSRSLPLEWVHIKVPDRSLEQVRLTSDPITEVSKDGVSTTIGVGADVTIGVGADVTIGVGADVTIGVVADVISVVYGGLVMSGVERVIVVVDISEVYIVVCGVVVSAK